MRKHTTTDVTITCPACHEEIAVPVRSDRTTVVTSCPHCRGAVNLCIHRGPTGEFTPQKAEWLPSEHKAGAAP